MLKEGDKAPEFEMADAQGKMHTLNEYKGKKVVLYFYPKDDTPGCTIEACGFRDLHGAIKNKNAVVLGVSPDNPESHEKFVQKFGLPFTLLWDVDKSVCKAYGAWGKKNFMGKEFDGLLRTTFIIGESGKIEKIFRDVKPSGHDKEVLESL